MDEQNREEAPGAIHVTSKPLTLGVKVNPMKVLMRTYFSRYHLWSAKYFAAQAQAIEKEPGELPRFDLRQRAYVTNGVLSSFAFLEAALNELYADVFDDEKTYTHQLDGHTKTRLKTLWKLTVGKQRSLLPTLENYQLTLVECGKEELDVSAQPYQNASFLVKLRNELVHPKPFTSGEGEAVHALERHLKTRFAENPLMVGSGNAYFADKCLGSPCAEWAVLSAKAFADEVWKRLGTTPPYEGADAWPITLDTAPPLKSKDGA